MESNKSLKFYEVSGYTIKEAIDEAKRCLNCKNPSCRKGCPIENDIPSFIHQLSMGNMGDAMAVINERSNLPAICGRVCPHEKQCEGHCVLYPKGKGIRIGMLERFIAGDLARQGFNVTIFESQSEPGGVLMFGIPEYRLPKEVVRKEIKKIEALGVTFITNCVVGQNIDIDRIFAQEYDAVFIGSGTALPKSLNIPGNDLKGIVQSSYFLRMVSLYNFGDIDRREVPVHEGEVVGVIGCGNVGMDAARTALRMGAKVVYVIYHKTENEMSALRSEYEDAVAEGVKFLWRTATQEFICDNNSGWITGLKVDTPEGEKVLSFNRILLAIGSRPANRIVSTTTGIDVDSSGYVITKDRPYGMTTRKGVFAGGDVVHTPQTVVLAMKEAKKVAVGIAQYVDAKKLLGE